MDLIAENMSAFSTKALKGKYQKLATNFNEQDLTMTSGTIWSLATFCRTNGECSLAESSSKHASPSPCFDISTVL